MVLIVYSIDYGQMHLFILWKSPVSRYSPLIQPNALFKIKNWKKTVDLATKNFLPTRGIT